MAKKPEGTAEVAPDQRQLTSIQAARIGALANIDAKQLQGKTIADISARLKWQIHPELFLFRRICGKVVKKDPVTGTAYPVPFATVIVEDTDCNFLSYFPKTWPWGWFFPLFCKREVLATVQTDKCGNFCVWVPRFEIDWILRWRKQRICFPDVFVRPTIKDLIPIEEIPRPPRPGPDPGPLATLATLPPSVIEAVAGPAGAQLARRLNELQHARLFGAPAAALEDLLEVRAFDAELPPPLPEEFRRVLSGHADVAAEKKRGTPQDAITAAIALQAGVDRKAIANFDIHRYIGPFRRCFDIYTPEWQLLFDVPDITFRVTQDTNGDGTEETIYSESYFDVRWNAGAIPDVTLVASAIAKESHLCDTPDVICGTVPAILFAGLMPLTDTAYFDAATGYAKRPNRPIPPSGPRPDAQTPFLRVLQLYGCVNVQNAQFYRVLLSSDDGASFSAITGLSWNLYPIPSGPPLSVTSDSNGWYPVLPNPTDFHPSRMVLEWPTPSIGKFVLKLELGNAGKNVINTSANVAIRVDNTNPTVLFNTLKWKFAAEPDSAFDAAGRNLLAGSCPTIHRGASPQAIEVKFEVTIAAPHLRNGSIYVITCGSGALAPMDPPTPHTAHWHETVTDNSEFLHGRYHIAASHAEGAYRFGCIAISRAMNPAGSDNGHLLDWLYDSPAYAYVQPEIHVAIVNA
jgi:hypothetical protein